MYSPYACGAHLSFLHEYVRLRHTWRWSTQRAECKEKHAENNGHLRLSPACRQRRHNYVYMSEFRQILHWCRICLNPFYRSIRLKAGWLIYRVHSGNCSSFSPLMSSWPWSTTDTCRTHRLTDRLKLSLLSARTKQMIIPNMPNHQC